MRYVKHVLVVALLVLVGITAIQVRINDGRAAGKPDRLPTGGLWSLYSMPYIDPDIGRKPVIVRSVTTDAEHGLTINKVGILSRSKAVKSVRLRWYLSDDKSKGAVLLQGETPTIKFDKGLPAGGAVEVRQEVVSFEKILDRVKDEAARGAKFHIDVCVSSVVYADGGTWEEQAKTKLDYLSLPQEARSHGSLPDYESFLKETWPKDGPFIKIGYARSSPEPMPQSCIPTYTACVYHPCGGNCCGCYWTDCSNPIPSPSMCQADGISCTTIYCG